MNIISYIDLEVKRFYETDKNFPVCTVLELGAIFLYACVVGRFPCNPNVYDQYASVLSESVPGVPATNEIDAKSPLVLAISSIFFVHYSLTGFNSCIHR